MNEHPQLFFGRRSPGGSGPCATPRYSAGAPARAGSARSRPAAAAGGDGAAAGGLGGCSTTGSGREPRRRKLASIFLRIIKLVSVCPTCPLSQAYYDAHNKNVFLVHFSTLEPIEQTPGSDMQRLGADVLMLHDFASNPRLPCLNSWRQRGSESYMSARAESGQ
jgi:hypothetical protein